MKLYVREVPLDGSEHRRKWAVDTDCGENFNYRGRTSSNAFFYSDKKRNYNGTLLYYAEPLSEARCSDEFNIDDYEEVESIWKFYEIIGYDYKKKKFTS